MRGVFIAFVSMATMLAINGSAQSGGPYKVLKVDKVGGDGGFDYVYADVAGRRLYIPRSGQNPRVMVYNLDTLAPVGEIPKTGGMGSPSTISPNTASPAPARSQCSTPRPCR